MRPMILPPGTGNPNTLRNRIAADSWNRQRRPRGADAARWTDGTRHIPEVKWHEAMERLCEVPDDTRSLTARICGDPLPGRSVLDRRAPE